MLEMLKVEKVERVGKDCKILSTRSRKVDKAKMRASSSIEYNPIRHSHRPHLLLDPRVATMGCHLPGCLSGMTRILCHALYHSNI